MPNARERADWEPEFGIHSLPEYAEQDAPARECRIQYPTPADAAPNTRIVRCGMSEGHSGPHMEIDHDGSVMNEWPQVAPAVPSTSDEDVYQRAARAYQAHSQHHRDINKLAAHGPFRAAVDAALDAAYPDPDAVLVDLDAANRELAAARAEIAAQAATITELRAELAARPYRENVVLVPDTAKIEYRLVVSDNTKDGTDE
jgi:hypothetical protein